MREALGKPPPDCAACDAPPILEENHLALAVLNATGAALFDGWGGVRLENAKLMAEALGVEWDYDLAAKLLAAAQALREDSGS